MRRHSGMNLLKKGCISHAHALYVLPLRGARANMYTHTHTQTWVYSTYRYTLLICDELFCGRGKTFSRRRSNRRSWSKWRQMPALSLIPRFFLPTRKNKNAICLTAECGRFYFIRKALSSPICIFYTILGAALYITPVNAF